ncbi:MAG: hypothetical protein AB8F26_10715 [Phycisphaerales bacterium]
MSFLASITGSKAIVSVLAIGAGSVLGYNWVTTGCPSGTCPTERAAARITQASMVETEDLGSACSTKSADSCCPLTAETTAEMTNVAAELPACCAELGEPACGDASNCTDMAAPEDSTVVIETVANEAAQSPSECSDNKDACCPLTEAAEQTASNAP